MKTITKGALALAFMATVGSASAAETLTRGVIVGFTSANLGGSDSDIPGLTRSAKTGFAGGGFYKSTVSDDIAYRLDVYFIQKGAEYSANGATVAYNSSYIQEDILFQYKLPVANVSPHIFAGPFLAFNMISQFESGGVAIDIKDSTKFLDYGLVLGGGVELNKKFLVDVRYSMSLASFDGSSNPDDLKHKGLLVTAGIAF